MIRRTSLSLLLVALLAAVGLTACDSVIETTPEQSLPPGAAFNSPQGAESVLLGAYEGLQDPGAYGGIGLMAADISTDNAVFSGSFTTFQAIQGFDLLSTSGPALDIWDDYYETINTANEVIANAADVPDINPDVAARYVAEARFIRALAYHNLLRYFALPYDGGTNSNAPGVPLVLEPTREPGGHVNRPRATVAQVYQQINTDLTEAAGVESLSPGGGMRAGFGSVRGLQARVALYQENYGDAVDYATDVIEMDDIFMLLSNVQDIYSLEPTAEDVFVVANSITDNSGTNDFPSSFYMPSSLGGRGDINPGDDLLTEYEEGDLRRENLFYTVSSTDERVFNVTNDQCINEVDCWTHKYRSDNFADDIRVIRLAEMYLTRAEAYARLGNLEAAVEDLNEIRERADLTTVEVDDFEGQDALVDEIIAERRRELAFEGDYRHDVVRRGAPLTASGVTAPETQRIFPIPQEEIDANGAISQEDQNPGY